MITQYRWWSLQRRCAMSASQCGLSAASWPRDPSNPESGQGETISPDADRRLRFALLEEGGPSMARSRLEQVAPGTRGAWMFMCMPRCARARRPRQREQTPSHRGRSLGWGRGPGGSRRPIDGPIHRGIGVRKSTRLHARKRHQAGSARTCATPGEARVALARAGEPLLDAASRLRCRQPGRRLCGQINGRPRAPVSGVCT